MATLQRRAYRGGTNTPAACPAKCAWVVLVMLGPGYVPGAVVAASSLRRLKTRHSIVCMVTDDVPEPSRAELRLVFDDVVEVAKLSGASRPMLTEKQSNMYGSWISHSYTKWACLTLAYDKVVLIDADMLFLANSDSLFELAAPAACFSIPWAPPWGSGDIMNPYISRGARDITHGTRIPATAIMAAIGSKTKTYVAATPVVVLTPDAEMYAALARMLNSERVYAEKCLCVNGVDEISVAELYARAGQDWTHIHQRYMALPWKKQWVDRDIHAFHFHGRKPWLMSPKDWPDLAVWWTAAAAAQELAPGLTGLLSPDLTPTVTDIAAADLHLTRVLAAAFGERQPGRTTAAWLRAQSEGGRIEHSLVHRSINIADVAKFSRDPVGTVKLTAKHLARPPQRSNTLVVCDEKCLAYGSSYYREMDPIVRDLVSLAGPEQVLTSLMTHAAAIAPNPGRNIFGNLYSEGYRFEIFTSPITRLLSGPDAKYCTAFPSIDTPLGALGDFFELTAGGRPLPEGDWLFHPAPVIPIRAVIRRCCELLARDGFRARMAFIGYDSNTTDELSGPGIATSTEPWGMVLRRA